ncbi:hypothetical protein ACUODJ_47635, partial [Escherichia sp. HC-CC]
YVATPEIMDITTIMKSTIEEKQKRELLEIIFNRPIKGEGYIHGASYKWKQIVFQHYNKIKRKEITVFVFLRLYFS